MNFHFKRTQERATNKKFKKKINKNIINVLVDTDEGDVTTKTLAK